MANRLAVGITSALVLASVLIFSCSQAASAPAPPQPTAVLAQSTTAPAKTVNFPEKGKTITVIVPFAAGGSSDVGTRLVAAGLEQEMGVPVRVVNKPGASTQVGMTELVKSKPDGYTLGYITLPSGIIAYLDPARQAVYSRKNFQPLASHVVGPSAVGVKVDSPYKTVRDLLDDAKAKPGQLKAGDTGLMSVRHISVLQTEQVAGVKFASVHFDGGGPATTALLGGHVDVGFQDIAEFLPHVTSNNIRILAVLDKQESQYLPGVKTMEAQGYKADWLVNYGGWVAPAGTPMEVMDRLSQALKKVITSEDHKMKATKAMLILRYMSPDEFAAVWSAQESQSKPLMELGKEKK